MIDVTAYLMISIVTFCFGLLVSFQIAHIYYVRKITRIAKRCIDTATIAPLLIELEQAHRLDGIKEVSLDAPGKKDET
jgi:hypothetical protein